MSYRNINKVNLINLSAENVALSILRRTPLFRSPILSYIFQNNIFLKLESLQTSGSFKIRGGIEVALKFKQMQTCRNESLGQINYTHISTYTTGNHGIAMAYLAENLDIQVKIFAPQDISVHKINKIRQYRNTELILTNTRQEAEDRAKSNSGGYFVHPSANLDGIKGISMLFDEITEQMSEYYSANVMCDVILAPCGGGGLITGLHQGYLEHTKKLNGMQECAHNIAQTQIWACEPLNANDAYISRQKGQLFRFDTSPSTQADALRALSISQVAFDHIKQIAGVFVLSEEEITNSYKILRQVLQQELQTHAEISSAIVLGGLCKWKVQNYSKTGKDIVLIISGNNNLVEEI